MSGSGPGAGPSTGPQELQHPRFARAFAGAVAEMDSRGAREHRRRLVQGLSGRVVELGAGTGATFPLYPGTVSEVVALEPDDYLRSLAVRAAAAAPVPVRVLAGRAEELPLDDGSVDAVVASLVLCSVADQAAVLREVRRVLRPGGVFAFYEHVRSDRPVLAVLEDVVAPLWGRAAGGCHPNRDTAASVRAAGFELADVERFRFSPQRFTPPVAHVLGRGRKV